MLTNICQLKLVNEFATTVQDELCELWEAFIERVMLGKVGQIKVMVFGRQSNWYNGSFPICLRYLKVKPIATLACTYKYRLPPLELRESQSTAIFHVAMDILLL